MIARHAHRYVDAEPEIFENTYSFFLLCLSEIEGWIGGGATAGMPVVGWLLAGVHGIQRVLARPHTAAIVMEDKFNIRENIR